MIRPSEALARAREYQGNPAYIAVLDLIEARLFESRLALEDVSAERFLFAQGRARALRDLFQDLSGRKL